MIIKLPHSILRASTAANRKLAAPAAMTSTAGMSVVPRIAPSQRVGILRHLQTDATSGFDTIALHGGHDPDPSVPYGLGYGAPRGVPLYRSTPFVFRDTEHARKLFALEELGNIYSRLMNPTNHILESRYAQLEGGHPLSGLSVSSGTTAVFYAIANLASAGDNIVASSALYGGTYT
jgi:O-acetylhomoserine (thiol)-lyase